MNIYRILIIDDKKEEATKAEQALRELKTEERSFVTSGAFVNDRYLAFMLLTGERSSSSNPMLTKWDGVLCDLNFPDAMVSGEPFPYGMEVAAYCVVNNIPCVVCTDADGHQMIREKTTWINEVLHRLGVPLVCNKDWKEATSKMADLIAQRTN